MTVTTVQAIPDIQIGRVYDRRDPECEIHYETFARLADFFGRNTPPHRHYCFFQLHLLTSGSINLNLDGCVYAGKAPLLIFTPPTLPHSFYSEEDTDGHVLTVRQEVVRSWYSAMPGQWPESLLREPAFLELDSLKPEKSAQPPNSGENTSNCSNTDATATPNPDFIAMMQSVELLQYEFSRDARGHATLMRALAESVFIHLSRLLLMRGEAATQRPERSEDLRLFLNFCDLVEAHFRDHLTLNDYAGRLSVTEARLNDICRRMAERPSKEIVHERLLQEARRMLRYSAVPVSEISYQLGFSDPAYFSRFFTKRTGTPPSQFRLSG